MKQLKTAIAILSVLIVALAVIITAKYCAKIDDTETTTVTTTETTTESTETSTTEPILDDSSTETTTDTTTTTELPKSVYIPSPHLTEDNYITPEFFRQQGVIYGDGYRWTWYSEKVLPGNGLDIPGRHSDGNYVLDENDYIVLASPDLEKLPKGTVIETPFGWGKVYDHCPIPGTVDVYTSF